MSELLPSDNFSEPALDIAAEVTREKIYRLTEARNTLSGYLDRAASTNPGESVVQMSDPQYHDYLVRSNTIQNIMMAAAMVQYLVPEIGALILQVKEAAAQPLILEKDDTPNIRTSEQVEAIKAATLRMIGLIDAAILDLK